MAITLVLAAADQKLLTRDELSRGILYCSTGNSEYRYLVVGGEGDRILLSIGPNDISKVGLPSCGSRLFYPAPSTDWVTIQNKEQ